MKFFIVNIKYFSLIIIFLINIKFLLINTLEIENLKFQNISNSVNLSDQNFLNFFATTPKIFVGKNLSDYEKGLEDYEEAVARLDNEIKTKNDKKIENNFKTNPLLILFDVLSKMMTSNVKYNKSLRQKKSLADDYQEDREIHESENDEENLDVTDRNSDPDDGMYEVSETMTNGTTTAATEVEEGRYIKGDPLNGYYDFIITEGSFKFWATFQLATAALIIYSTFAAIYYSQVNPLTGDYDYVDYLGGGRSMQGRSMSDNTDDGPPDVINDGNSYWSSVVHGSWLGTASHAFQFVLDAIEKVPQ